MARYKTGFAHTIRSCRPEASCLVACLLVLLFPVSSHAQRLYMKSYSTEDGLPSAQVFSSLQDDKGYMWFGSSGGLVKYDGADFTVFSAQDGLPSNAIRSIIEVDGVLWLTSEGGVTRYDGKTFTNYSTRDGLGAGIVWHAAVHDGCIWFATGEGGLSRFDGKTFKTFTTKDGLPDNHVFSLLSDGPTLWVGTRGGGLARFDGTGFETFGEERGMTSKYVFVVQKCLGALWVGTKDRGLFKLDKDRFVNTIEDVFIYSGTATADQCLWGTIGEGVIRMSRGGTSSITVDSGLCSNRVYSILVDRERTVWFTTSAGISKLLSDRFVSYLDGRHVLSVARYGQSVWFGTLGDGLYEMKGGTIRLYTTKDGMLDDVVFSLAVFKDKLWIGTGRGLSSFDGETFTAYADTMGLAFPTVYSIMPHGQDLWLATLSGVSRFDGEHFTGYDTSQGLLSMNVRSVAGLGDSVCFGVEGGVSCLEGDRFVNYIPPNRSVYALAPCSRGGLWVGTANGLYRFEGGRFEPFTPAGGLISSVIPAVVEHEGILWIGTNRGLSLFDGKSVFKVYNAKNSPVGNEFNLSSIFIDGDGSAWLGTSKRVTHVLAGADQPNRTPPPVYLKAFLVNGEPRWPADGLELRYDENNVTFQYEGLSFKDERNVLYQYRLEGFDRGWSAPTGDRQVRYTQLKHGAYTFKVKARNEDGTWSKKCVELSFMVLPPVWSTWWFIFLVILASGTILALGVQWRLRALRARTIELEATVRERTRELDEANRELKELTLIDPLTKLRNRRFMAETIENEIAKCLRAYTGLSRGEAPNARNIDIGFTMIDIDHFKRVNDDHGHEAGDAVLQQIASILRRSSRQSDDIIRWGGEEFLIVSKNVDRNFMHKLARRYVDAVRNHRFPIPGGMAVTLTCSIGFSLYPFCTSAAEMFNYQEIINFSDAALYIAKQNGRDLAVGIVEGARAVEPEARGRLKNDILFGSTEGYVKILCDREGLRL